MERIFILNLIAFSAIPPQRVGHSEAPKLWVVFPHAAATERSRGVVAKLGFRVALLADKTDYPRFFIRKVK